MARGALGAVVIADTQRLPNSFAAIDYFEGRGLSFAIAVNCFDGTAIYTIDAVYNALDLDRHVPIVLYDAQPRILQDGATDLTRAPTRSDDVPDREVIGLGAPGMRKATIPKAS